MFLLPQWLESLLWSGGFLASSKPRMDARFDMTFSRMNQLFRFCRARVCVCVDRGRQGIFSSFFFYLWWLERVLWREMDVEEEDAAFVNWSRRSQNRRYPFVEIITFRTSTANIKNKQTNDWESELAKETEYCGFHLPAVGRRIECDFCQLFLYPAFQSNNSIQSISVAGRKVHN